ncbi:MAG TPA: hypothetical protein VK043_02130 [Burkholderiales bacterium]|nr:hypothetical protein [Burkholderiales bacterium]
MDGQLASYLEQTEVLACEPPRLRLGFEQGFMFERELTHPDAVAAILPHFVADFGAEASIEFVHTKAACTIGTVRNVLKERERQAQIEEITNHPRVKQVVETLGARIRQVVLPD